MKHRRYAPADAETLAPLLASLGRELEERGRRLAEIEARIGALHASPFYSPELRELEAEASIQLRELRHCREELERLGCSVVGTTPLTIRVATRVDGTSRSRVWRHGHGARGRA